MKKVLVIAMAALFITGMASCSGNNATSEETTEQAVSTDSIEIKDNLTLGREFLAENAKNDSVVQTESGLQYMVLKEGTGAKPGPTDTVTVHYTGKLLDGTVFDSSVERGEPINIPIGVGQVIPGWDEGIMMMSKGEKGVLYIPYYLAYGDRPAGDKITPFSNLIFEVELVDFE